LPLAGPAKLTPRQEKVSVALFRGEMEALAGKLTEAFEEYFTALG